MLPSPLSVFHFTWGHVCCLPISTFLLLHYGEAMSLGEIKCPGLVLFIIDLTQSRTHRLLAIRICLSNRGIPRPGPGILIKKWMDVGLKLGHGVMEGFLRAFEKQFPWPSGRATQNHASSSSWSMRYEKQLIHFDSRSEGSLTMKLKLPQKEAEQTGGRNVLALRNLWATASNPPKELPTSGFSL